MNVPTPVCLPPFLCHTLDEAEALGRHEFVSRRDINAFVDDESQVDACRRAFDSSGVTDIVLVHGTFAGNDSLGTLRRLASFSPGLADQWMVQIKRGFDQLAGEVGNFTQDYADQMLARVQLPGGRHVRVDRLHWSGENHTLGRANAVMALFSRLISEGGCERVLIMAHSHGGNVVAMLSHLIATNADTRKAFCRNLRLSPGELDRFCECEVGRMPKIDVVNFGTPLRYRWNVSAIANLMHVVQHRSLDPSVPARAEFPTSVEDLRSAAAGDYVQQIGIAGTDFPAVADGIGDLRRNRRLRKMFESDGAGRDLVNRLRRGRRCSLDGVTLLMDYPDDSDKGNRKLFGHGVYTASKWIPFHMKMIGDRFYGLAGRLDERDQT
ncbi:hypothetical protein Poly51_45070 [Rubripirellula tenax]|uniref:Alpha/beta hydrolase family protein n=1 Tax=Rubripirellula tenax TaxID=2528015 RepID=A0A5C6ELX3_9BACT|nr:hypothetical protein [Rubripirellula tenax]TWU48606.1 hypothetical protein Poly51_45070 [Rubripirellula tenax]